jgi:hypothetical protein
MVIDKYKVTSSNRLLFIAIYFLKNILYVAARCIEIISLEQMENVDDGNSVGSESFASLLLF